MPVETEGVVDGFQVALVAWATANGRLTPLADFVLAPGEDMEPIVATVMNVVEAEEVPVSTKSMG